MGIDSSYRQSSHPIANHPIRKLEWPDKAAVLLQRMCRNQPLQSWLFPWLSRCKSLQKKVWLTKIASAFNIASKFGAACCCKKYRSSGKLSNRQVLSHLSPKGRHFPAIGAAICGAICGTKRLWVHVQELTNPRLACESRQWCLCHAECGIGCKEISVKRSFPKVMGRTVRNDGGVPALLIYTSPMSWSPCEVAKWSQCL